MIFLLCLFCVNSDIVKWEVNRIFFLSDSGHHHQWRYSPDRALASLTGFMIVIVRCGLSAPRSTWFYTL
jgi:hypothetical protein